MRTIIICSGGEDGKDVRTAIRIEDALFAKMFGSHIEDAMSFDEVELYLETAVEKIKSSYGDKLSEYEDMERIKEYLKFDCENVDRGKPLTEMGNKIQDLENRLEEMAKQRNYFKDELDKRDREIEQLKEAVVRANENADSYYKLYSSERDACKKARSMSDDLNTDFLEVREIVAKKCKQWSETIWNAINELDAISKCEKPDDNSPVMIIRGITDDISDFGANNAQGLMEGYEKEEESE
jgi:chromosome segregation ATPase